MMAFSTASYKQTFYLFWNINNKYWMCYMYSRLTIDYIDLIRGAPGNYDKVLEFCMKFYRTRTPLLTEMSEVKVRFDGRAEFIQGMLDNPSIHDEDYEILKYLKSEDSILLDVGANWGYSAGAFIKLGIKSKIVSFEVISYYDYALGELVKRYPDRYAYFLTGLGETSGSLIFVVPVLNGVANSGLCSANITPYIEGLARNILDYADVNKGLGDNLQLRFLEFTAEIRTLDEIVPSKLPAQWQELPIEAIKIDVEGLECLVLSGASQLLKRHRPLVLAEGANRTEGIQDLMVSLGYVFAEKEGEKLNIVQGIGMKVNGFFLHHGRLAEYQAAGVLRL